MPDFKAKFNMRSTTGGMVSSFSGEGGMRDHQKLHNRDAVNAHPIGAISGLEDALDSKVDVENGKGLSENDFTDAYKAKLDGIEAGADANVIESIVVNGVEATVEGKAASITLPTAVSDLDNDLGYLTEEEDPTVPAWAKAQNKPTYTPSEVGAQPAIDVDGILKGDGNGIISAAVAGVDYQPPLPDITGNSNKYLKTNGEILFWDIYDTLPEKSGNAGKYLTTNGQTAMWSDAVMVKGVDYVTAGQNVNNTLGSRATAEGYSTTASGYLSHAEGQQSTASSTGAHAEGLNTTASNLGAHAEGFSSTASGVASHAEASGTASGGYSHAEGFGEASALYAHAEGYTTANHKYQHTFGSFNVLDPTAGENGTYIEIVGNGTASNNRSNARTLDWSGNEVLAGKLTVGAAPTNNMDVATKQYVDGLIPSVPSGSSTSPAMDGIASAGSETTWAHGDHVHPTDTSRQATITASGILKGDGAGGVTAATAGTDYDVPELPSQTGNNGKFLTTNGSAASWAAVTQDDHKWNDVALSHSISDYTNAVYIPELTTSSGTSAGLATASSTPGTNRIAKYDANSYLNSTTPSANDNSTRVATTAYVDSAAAPEIFVATYGTTTYNDILTAYNADKFIVATKTGDYTVPLIQYSSSTFYFYYATISSGNVFRCTSSGWESGTISFVPTGRKVNNQSLSSDITLTASDVGAQPSISASGILKGDGSGGVSAATAGTDYQAPLPSQTSQSGKFLTTNGTNLSWATVDALPSQTGNNGKFLTTNGSAASWAAVSVPTKVSDLNNDSGYLTLATLPIYDGTVV